MPEAPPESVPETVPETVLEIADLVAGYGRQPVLHGVSLRVARGEALGLIGPNGHGKTTLFRAVSGLIPVWQGSVRFLGEDITRLSAPEIAERGLIHVPQGNRLLPDMTVDEALNLGAFAPAARSARRATRAQVDAIFPRLAERRRQRCRTLSGGERQMASLGCGLMGQPRLLILDEPTLGLSPRLKSELRDAIAAIVESGVQVLIVEQDPEFLRTLTDRQIYVEEGRVRADFEAGTLEHDRIMEMYFGLH